MQGLQNRTGLFPKRLFGWVFALALLANAGTAVAEEPEADDRVAPFQLKSLDGDVFDYPKDMKGRVMVLSFWRLGQDRSVSLLRDLVDLREAFSVEEVSIVGVVTVVSGETNRAELKALTQELGISFPVLIDPDREVYGAFGVRVSPSTWFIDADGKKVATYPGYRRGFAKTARADIDLLLGRISEEERDQRIAKKKAPRTKGTAGATVQYRFAIKLLKDGQRDEGKDQLRRAWEAEPPEPEAGVDLGLLLLEDGEVKEALEVLNRAVELLPENARAKGAKGVALVRSGQEEEGEVLLRWALDREVAEAVFFYEMGKLTEGRGATEEALRYYRAGLELMLGVPSDSDETP